MIKSIKWGLLSCALSLCSVQAIDYSHLDVPGLVQPYILCEETRCLSPCTGWNAPFRFSLSHTEGKWYDIEVGYTSLESFLAFVPDQTIIPFADVKWHLFNNGRWAANIGGGLRYTANQGRNIFGVNLFYDYRESNRHHNFNQIGFGFEYLSSCLDVRLNFYFSGDTKDKTRVHFFDDYIGPFWALCRDTRRSLSGGDLEFGSWLVPRAPCQFVNLYLGITPYYFNSSKHHRSDEQNKVYGVTGRLMTLLGEYFTLELRGGYDKSYKGMIQGILSFEMPLDKLFHWETWFKDGCGNSCGNDWENGCGNGCQLSCRAYQPVVRQEMIVLSPKSCCWESNF